MPKGKRKIKLIVIGLSLGFLIFLAFKIVDGFVEIQNDMAKDLPPTYEIPSEDSSIISKKYLGKLKANEIIRRQGREPVSLIYFDRKYHLIIYKFTLDKSIPLGDLLHLTIKNVDQTIGAVYKVISHNNFFKFQLNDAPGRSVSNVYLTLAGDSLQNVVKNDSMVGYHLSCTNLSIRYDENGPIDIFMVGAEKMLGATTDIPMNILFSKQKRNLFLLIMTPNNSNSTIPPILLYNIVMGI
jgi:hypothetical protein